MAYVILVNDDDSLYGSKKCRIMQRQKLVNDLIFIVNPIYRNTHDMTKASVLLEYVLPISRKYETVYLEPCKERYNDFLQYKLPFDTNLTSEHGKVELQLTFAYAEMDEEGKIAQRVRKTSTTTIDIIPISTWSDIIPDKALGGLDERLIVLNGQIQALNDYMNVLDNTQVDNLVYNSTDETLQLSSKGKGVGNKVSVRDMLDDGIPVIDLDSNSDSGDNSDIDHNNDCNNDCNCDCGDNVVEFGDIIASEQPKNDNNVVEF